MTEKFSHAVPIPGLSLWNLPGRQDSIEEYVEAQIRPATTYDYNNPITFFISNAREDYWSPSDSELYIKMTVTPTFNTTDPLTQVLWENNIVPVDNFMHSLFRKIDLIINGKNVSDDSTDYGFKAHLENKLGFSDSAQKSQLSTIIFGEASERNKFIPNFLKKDFKSATFWLGGPLNFDLNFQDKLVLGGTDIVIQLLAGRDPKFLFKLTEKVTSVDIKFDEVVYYATKFRVSKELLAAHTLALERSAARYPFTRNSIKTFTIASGVNRATLNNCFIGTLPRRIFVTAIKESTYNGSYGTDTMGFVNAGVSKISVLIDGKQFPNTSYSPQFVFDDKTYKTGHSPLAVREYRGFLKAIGENHSSAKIGLSYFDWARHPVYGFNFAPDLSGGASGSAGYHVSETKSGQLSIDLEFSAPLAESHVFIILGEFDKLLEIDQFGTVLIT